MSQMLENLIKEIKNKCSKCVVSLSGGLDSTTLTYLLVKALGNENVAAISFNYNQRHDVELKKAEETVKKLDIKHYEVFDISSLQKLNKNCSAMVKGDVKTPTVKEIFGDPQPVTYVPFRNGILCLITANYCESLKFDGVALGVQKIDSYSYWDTTLDSVDCLSQYIYKNRKANISVVTPFVNLSKIDEIKLGLELGIDYKDTWTCYNPQIEEKNIEYPSGYGYVETKYLACGICPSCSERLNSFKRVGQVDPIEYIKRS